jgi:hypothetical protein
MSKGIMRAIQGGIVVLIVSGGIGAGMSMAGEPSLLVYPDQPTIFRYDPARYELVLPSDPEFDTLFSVAGVMLWDRFESRVPMEVYRAPQLVGFEPSPLGMNEFVIRRNEFQVIVDGFNEIPRTFSNLYMRFTPDPSHSALELVLDGVERGSLIIPILPLEVSTPTNDGYYADTRAHDLRWSGAIGLRITVYSDKNDDMVYNGGVPRFSILVTDNTVATEETSWGELKAMYREP